MSKHEEAKGKPVAIDDDAVRASATEPAFVAPPNGEPVYDGCVVENSSAAQGKRSSAVYFLDKLQEGIRSHG